MGKKKLESGNWQIDYYFEGRRKRETFPSKYLAELALKKRKIEIAEGRFLDKKKDNKIKFEELARAFIEVYAKPNKKSWERDELSISHLAKAFNGKRIGDITVYDVEN
jgi:hypothetical protein